MLDGKPTVHGWRFNIFMFLQCEIPDGTPMRLCGKETTKFHDLNSFRQRRSPIISISRKGTRATLHGFYFRKIASNSNFLQKRKTFFFSFQEINKIQIASQISCFAVSHANKKRSIGHQAVQNCGINFLL